MMTSDVLAANLSVHPSVCRFVAKPECRQQSNSLTFLQLCLLKKCVCSRQLIRFTAEGTTLSASLLPVSVNFQPSKPNCNMQQWHWTSRHGACGCHPAPLAICLLVRTCTLPPLSPDGSKYWEHLATNMSRLSSMQRRALLNNLFADHSHVSKWSMVRGRQFL